jgi:hypothetical protein
MLASPFVFLRGSAVVTDDYDALGARARAGPVLAVQEG